MNKETLRRATRLGWLLSVVAVASYGPAWGDEGGYPAVGPSGRDALVVAQAGEDRAPGDAEREADEQERAARREEVEARLQEAQARLEEAAQEVAELSARLSEDALYITLRGLDEVGPRPMLGVNIGSAGDDSPGVGIVGVTPGGPADEAGLRSGDVMIAIDDEDLIGDHAADRLSAFMKSVQPGQEVTVRFRRDGREESVVVRPEEMDPFHFVIGAPGADWEINLQGLAELEKLEELAELEFSAGRHGVHFGAGFPGRWRSLEMVTLTPELGEYFDAERGLLVVRAPEDESLGLADGDVILAIDGREPTSPRHAMRILRSYEAGETITFSIVRKKKSQTLEVLLPKAAVGHRWEWSLPVDQAVQASKPRVAGVAAVGT
jgi:predicted metalloprotease with PDZ domain